LKLFYSARPKLIVIGDPIVHVKVILHDIYSHYSIGLREAHELSFTDVIYKSGRAGDPRGRLARELDSTMVKY
jgi:hypothetical protein